MIWPAVVKYVFNAATVPAKVRAVAVPPTVIPCVALPVSVPSATASVTVSVALSTSAKGVPVYVRLPATSSVTAKLAGAVTVGVSFTAVRLTTRLVVVLAAPSVTDTAKVSVVAALRALIAAALGVKVYAPVAVVTVRVT